MINGPLPYSTRKFRISIGDNNDQITVPQMATYGYDYMKLLDSANKGNLVLTITYRKSGRIRGTVTGDINRDDIHTAPSKKLDCNFDLSVPFE